MCLSSYHIIVKVSIREMELIKHQVKRERCEVMDVTMKKRKYTGMLHDTFEGDLPFHWDAIKLSSYLGKDSFYFFKGIRCSLLTFLPLLQFCDLGLCLGNILLGHAGLCSPGSEPR